MSCFFVAPEQIVGKQINIIGSDIGHIKNVLRLKENDKIEVRDGNAIYYFCSIKKLAGDKITCEILSKESGGHISSIKITLAQSLPKAKKMDLIIQKATELGASAITPIISERTIVKIDGKENKKTERWQKIAKSAAQQSKQNFVPKINSIIPFKEALEQASNFDLCLIPWEMESKNSLKNILKQNMSAKNILLFIGPEGGFSNKEIMIAKEKGIIPVSLGKKILRTETAPIATIANILYELE